MEEARGRSGTREESLGENIAIRVDHNNEFQVIAHS
jgi:hypothetical protein